MKITNDVLSEYMSLVEAMKPMLARIEEIKEAIKERGTMVTTEYAVVVLPGQRVQMASVDTCARALGREKLETLGLISTSRFKTVKVNKREFAHSRAEA